MIYIIIVNYNGIKDTIECLDSLKDVNYSHYKIIVVDNGSSDNSLGELSKFSSTHLVVLSSPKNLGFAGGNNIGIRYALESGADYILLLNNDTLVTADFLSRLIECAKEQGENTIISPKIIYANDPQKIWYAGGTFNFVLSRTTHIGINDTDKGKYGTPKKISFISGCCMLIPAQVINNVGFIDESYFLYYEDQDYCCRLIASGYTLFYCPDAVIYHKVSMSTDKVMDTKSYYIIRNKFYIIKQYIARRYQWIAYIYTWLEVMIRMLKGEYTISVIYEAYTDYRKNKMGKRM